jgi:hypothetical protein
MGKLKRYQTIRLDDCSEDFEDENQLKKLGDSENP